MRGGLRVAVVFRLDFFLFLWWVGEGGSVGRWVSQGRQRVGSCEY